MPEQRRRNICEVEDCGAVALRPAQIARLLQRGDRMRIFVLVQRVLVVARQALTGGRIGLRPIKTSGESGIETRGIGVDADTAGLDAAFAGRFDGAQAYSAARQGLPRDNKNALYENEYAHTVAALEEARDLCGTQRDRTAVLDFANVSSSLFGHQPAG